MVVISLNSEWYEICTQEIKIPNLKGWGVRGGLSFCRFYTFFACLSTIYTKHLSKIYIYIKILKSTIYIFIKNISYLLSSYVQSAGLQASGQDIKQESQQEIQHVMQQESWPVLQRLCQTVLEQASQTGMQKEIQPGIQQEFRYQMARQKARQYL